MSDPRAWAFTRPILAENGGWAIFNGTPRGKNHAAQMFKEYADDPEWFTQRLTAHDTNVFSGEQLNQERRDYRKDYGIAVGDALYRQEYLCSFEAPVLGAYYAEWLDKAEDDGRICSVPYDPAGGPVHVSFDLGVGDQQALWFSQEVGREVHVLDYYASMGVGQEHYRDAILERFRRGQLGSLLLPHDATQREKVTGKSVANYWEEQKFDIVVVPRATNADALMQHINAVRRFFPRCVFDETKCANGLNALRNYRAEYDEDKRVLAGRPVHDWASHGADSWRTMVMGWDKATPVSAARPTFIRRKFGVPV
jgi:phage terminase large subunit